MPKSRVVAGILGIFLGGLGIHRFYLGYVNMGLIQICSFFGGLILGSILAFLSCGILFFLPILIPGIIHLWGIIEGVLILVKSTIVTDAYGNPLVD